MILPDVSLLIHAHNSDSAVHSVVRTWWDGCLAGSEGVGLAWAVILGFIRITTHPKVLTRPLPVQEVLARLESWLILPQIHIAHPSDRHFSQVRRHFDHVGTAGNLTTDAHLATLAVERGYILYSTDTDFARFPDLRWINPCSFR